MVILSLHIIVALITTLAIVGVAVSAYLKRETPLYGTMLISFAATVLSGVGLVFMVGGLGRFCAMMTAYVIFVAVARTYYRKQTAKLAL